MIIQFSVRNFKSIHEEVVFSMLASSDEAHEEYIRRNQNLAILPSTIIVGTNGAGKSNLFLSIYYLQELIKKAKHKVLPYFPHKLSENKASTAINIQFITGGVRYAYGISLLSDRIEEEYLIQLKDDEYTIIFERDETHLQVLEEKELRAVEPTHLALPILRNEFNLEEVHLAYDFLINKLVVITTEKQNDYQLFNEACSLFRKETNQSIVSTLIKRIDIGINDFYIDGDNIIVHYEHMDINLLEESTGTKKLFMLLTLISDSVNDGKVVLFDELEKNLHVMLVKTIVFMFNSKHINKERAQLIFSTHNTSMLNLHLFRRDQVWLMEKNLQKLNTELYSLYSIMDVLEDENIEHGYITGKYGATFKINFDKVVGRYE